ncbi:MAG TPA: tail fiber protein [Candidatus Dormibacteraeota bacterium]|nr:tail fiber protein [Candidatus Dormibacteraeota bacterium]
MSQPFIGEIRMFGGNFAPAGWALCNGALMAIDQNTALFQLIGTTYGGDGQTTFALPDLQSRVPVHQGPGFVIGQKAGVESHILTLNEMASHSHPAQATSGPGTTQAPSGEVWAQWSSPQFSGQTPNAALNAGAIGVIGGGQPHDNMIPFLTVNFIISLFGVFPSQT